MVELVANTGNPDQTLHSAASDLGLHSFCGVMRLIIFGLKKKKSWNYDKKAVRLTNSNSRILKYGKECVQLYRVIMISVRLNLSCSEELLIRSI